MWSNVYEKITDGTSGLSPNEEPKILAIGTSSKGEFGSTYAIGKKTNISKILGCGELAKRLEDMQLTMDDVSVTAVRVDGSEGMNSEMVAYKGTDVEISGVAQCSMRTKISVVQGGDFQNGEVSLDVEYHGDREGKENVILSQDGVLDLVDAGISVIFPIENAVLTVGDFWEIQTYARQMTFADLEKTLERVLEVQNPEVVYIAQGIDSDFVNRLGSLAERLFEEHKPVLFLTETNLDESLDLDVAINQKKIEFKDVNARFVSVVCQSGFVRTKNGNKFASPSGLCAGYITKSSVNQSIGATHYFPVGDYVLPKDWANEHSRSLDESRFITLRNYAGLKSLYWSNGRTMADNTSDYRFIEVVRTVFKAVRLARNATLSFIHAQGDEIGIQNLLAEVRNTLDTMTVTVPKELDSVLVSLPKGQDIVNNGVVLNLELFGIPIIRSIVLDFQFKYQNTTN